jgi:hypothetical protein
MQSISLRKVWTLTVSIELLHDPHNESEIHRLLSNLDCHLLGKEMGTVVVASVSAPALLVSQLHNFAVYLLHNVILVVNDPLLNTLHDLLALQHEMKV